MTVSEHTEFKVMRETIEFDYQVLSDFSRSKKFINIHVLVDLENYHGNNLKASPNLGL